ncbi:glycosyltransferase [Candidatus Gottesmanbacteria bacterium]|nr:glycosyltransferase [Candidatus Gottesmanbacteria bacterium]
MKTLLSIVIPAYNEEDFIIHLLNSLRLQKFNMAKTEIIVVNNGSDDSTSNLMKEYKNQYRSLNITLAKEAKRHVSAARNKGARLAKGKLLIFLDSDNIVYSDFLFQIYTKVFVEGYEAGTIFTLAIEDSQKGHKLFLLLELIKLTFGKPFGKCFCSKRIFNAVGGYNKSITIGTNLDFLLRVKKLLQQEGKMLAHIQKPIFTSLRRFEQKGYASVLIRWFLGYIGIRKVHYPMCESSRYVVSSPI